MTTESSEPKYEIPAEMPFGILAGAYQIGLIKIGSVYDKTEGIRASGLGMCARRQLYKLVEFPDKDKEPTGFKSLASMRFGTVIGDDIETIAADMINMLSAIDGNVWQCIAQAELKADMSFAGTDAQLVAHPDVMLVKVVDRKLMHVHIIDIKTTNPFGHKKQLADKGSEHHKYQVGMAMFMVDNIDMGELLGKHEGFSGLVTDASGFVVSGELFYISRGDGDYFSVPVDQQYAELAENRCAEIMEMINDRKDPGAVPVQSWECNYCDYKPGCHFSNINPFDLPFTADANIKTYK